MLKEFLLYALLIFIVVPVLSVLGQWITRAVFPNPRDRDMYYGDRARFDNRAFDGFESYSGLAFLLIGIAIGIGYDHLGTWWMPLWHSREDTAVYLYSEEWYWVFPSTCMGIALSYWIMIKISIKILGREDFRRYVQWSNHRHGFDVFAGSHAFAVLSLLAGLISTYTLLTHRVVVDDRIIRVKRGFMLSPKDYLIQDLDHLAYLSWSDEQNGEEVEGATYKLYANGEEIWSDDDGFDNDIDLINYLIEVRGIKFTEIPQ